MASTRLERGLEVGFSTTHHIARRRPAGPLSASCSGVGAGSTAAGSAPPLAGAPGARADFGVPGRRGMEGDYTPVAEWTCIGRRRCWIFPCSLIGGAERSAPGRARRFSALRRGKRQMRTTGGCPPYAASHIAALVLRSVRRVVGTAPGPAVTAGGLCTQPVWK